MKTFLNTCKKYWIIVALIAVLFSSLIFFCFHVSITSDYIAANVFSVLSSLFCGIIVSFSSFLLNKQKEANTAERQMVNLIKKSFQRTCHLPEDNQITEKSILDEYDDLYLAYWELCYLSEFLVEDEKFRHFSEKYSCMLKKIKALPKAKDKSAEIKIIKDHMNELQKYKF